MDLPARGGLVVVGDQRRRAVAATGPRRRRTSASRSPRSAARTVSGRSPPMNCSQAWRSSRARCAGSVVASIASQGLRIVSLGAGALPSGREPPYRCRAPRGQTVQRSCSARGSTRSQRRRLPRGETQRRDARWTTHGHGGDSPPRARCCMRSPTWRRTPRASAPTRSPTSSARARSTAYYLLASLVEEGFATHDGGLYRPRASRAAAPPRGRRAATRSRTPSTTSSCAPTSAATSASCATAGSRSPSCAAARASPACPGSARASPTTPTRWRWARWCSRGCAPRRVARYAARGLPALHAEHDHHSDELARELEQVREHGYAVDREEFDEDFCCVAAPVPGERGELRGDRRPVGVDAGVRRRARRAGRGGARRGRRGLRRAEAVA